MSYHNLNRVHVYECSNGHVWSSGDAQHHDYRWQRQLCAHRYCDGTGRCPCARQTGIVRCTALAVKISCPPGCAASTSGAPPPGSAMPVGDCGDCGSGSFRDVASMARVLGVPVVSYKAPERCPFCSRTDTHRGGLGETHHVFVRPGDEWPA